MTNDVLTPGAERAAADASLLRSRARRAAAWSRARRRDARRLRAVGAVAGLAALCGVAGAAERTGGEQAGERTAAPARAQSASMLERGDRGRAVRALQRALGVRADGVFGPRTARAVRRAQRRAGLTPDGVVGPATRAALGLDPITAEPVRARMGGETGRLLAKIARCESGGDPRAVSPDGRYRGKYQFSRATWRGLGGKGDPAKASEAEQDRRAAELLRQSGTSPWPSCA